MNNHRLAARLLVLGVGALASAAAVSTARAQGRASAGRASGTVEVFRRFADRTLRIQVSEVGSAAKASVGTGFYVDRDGHVVTNYHVVSRLITDPDRYRAELTTEKGETRVLAIVAFDVVNDLAVLSAPQGTSAFFTLSRPLIPQGARLYALGHPHDLGLSIVEGTYNGLLAHTLYPKIHFTGSLNPGMSGGPALAEDGSVVGVNVSTGGDEVSFLVPVAYATALLDEARRKGFRPPANLMGEVARQLRAYQDGYLSPLFAAGTPTVTIGTFTVPTKPAPFFRCWADVERQADQPYEVVDHECSTDDYVFISGEQSSGLVEVRHRVVSSARLTAPQFAALQSRELEGDGHGPAGDKGEVTVFKCETRNVRVGGARSGAPRQLRAQLCLRRYRKLEGLYDAVLRAAPLGGSASGGRRVGLVTTLSVSGVTFANVQRITERYLRTIAWRE